MEPPDHNMSEQNYWDSVQRARNSGRAYLAQSRLGPADQELLLDTALSLLEREWRRNRPVLLPEVWIRTVLRHKIGRLRSKGLTTYLEDEAPASAPELPSLCELLPDPRALLAEHEACLLGRLTPLEQRVYQAVRQGWSLGRCAKELSMSDRDVRTRFGRICKKLDGFLAYLVPPPLSDEACDSVDESRARSSPTDPKKNSHAHDPTPATPAFRKPTSGCIADGVCIHLQLLPPWHVRCLQPGGIRLQVIHRLHPRRKHVELPSRSSDPQRYG